MKGQGENFSLKIYKYIHNQIFSRWCYVPLDLDIKGLFRREKKLEIL